MKNISIALFAILILAACGGQKDPKEELAELRTQQAELEVKIDSLEAQIARTDTTKSGKIKDVVIADIATQSFIHYVDIQGMVEADENVSILPVMGGTVRKILVNEGDIVKQGQLLAELDNDVYVSQLNALQPSIATATDLFNRQKRLWDQKIGSEVQYIQAKTQKESLEKQAQIYQEQIELTRIKSPINGTVDFVGLKVGQLAAPQSPVAAFRVVNLNKLKVKANVAEANSAKVKKGNEVILYFPDLKKEVKSVVSYAARVIDPMTRSFAAEVTLDGGNEYNANMIALIRIVDYKADNAIVVPINLVQTSSDLPFVYVAVNESGKNVARKKTVTLGQAYNGNVEILQGLAAGEKLITVGAADMADGIEIKF
jgi:RND family efflux transporter MFP subunit